MAPVIRAIDLFCGVGGLTHGLIRGGIDVRAGIDIDADCRYAYERNNDAAFLLHDVASVTASEVNRLFGSARNAYRLLAGCAPCQPFSTYARSGRSQYRRDDWKLALTFARLARESKPDFVTMENVPQLADHPVFAEVLNELSAYRVSWAIVDCERFGVPQTRRRLVLMASRGGNAPLSLDGNGSKAQESVRSTIGNLPKVKAGGVSGRDRLHRASSLSPLNLRRIQASTPGGSWRDWPDDLRSACHRRPTGDTYPSVYGRMEWDKPAPTITTQCFGYGNGRFGHPEQDRAITLREAAMLQTFPLSYDFLSPGDPVRFNKLGRLIGNAVPVRLGEAVAEAFVRHIEES